MHQWAIEKLEPRRIYTPMQASKATAVPPAEYGISRAIIHSWHRRGILPRVTNSGCLKFTGEWLKIAAIKAGNRKPKQEEIQ